ncbi:MAG: tetratricopeptide repeat protein, partial [Pseudanabaena sp.]
GFMRNQLGAFAVLLIGLLPMQIAMCNSGWAQVTSDRKATADGLLEFGNQQNDRDLALQSYKSALEIYRAIKDRNGEGKSLNNLGDVYRKQARLDKAIDYYKESLAIFKQIGDRTGEGRSLNNLGLVFQMLGQYTKAIDFYQQSIALNKQIGNREQESTSLFNLGDVYRKQARLDK